MGLYCLFAQPEVTRGSNSHDAEQTLDTVGS